MQPLKLAYEWIGPGGPISNNDYPNINDLRRQYDYHALLDPDYPVRNTNLKLLFKDVYDTEVTPVSSIKDNDFFLYEINHDWRHRFLFDTTYANNISRRIKNILNNESSRGYYAFNFAIEGEFNHHFQHDLYNLLRKSDINPNKVIYFTGCLNAQALNDKFVRENNTTGSIKFVNYMHWSNIQKQEPIDNNKPRSKKFICINRNWKHHRFLLYIYLHKNDLLKHFYFSFPKESPTRPGEIFHDIAIQAETRYRIGITMDDINAAYDALPLVVDTDDFSGLDWNNNRQLRPYYEDSYVSLVPETFYSEQSIFPTEKVFRPMSFTQPFVVLSNAGYLKELRATGVKTFSDLIDESYDNITSDSDRLKAVLQQIKDMCSWPNEKFDQLLASSRGICEDNYNLVSSNSFLNIAAKQLINFGER